MLHRQIGRNNRRTTLELAVVQEIKQLRNGKIVNGFCTEIVNDEQVTFLYGSVTFIDGFCIGGSVPFKFIIL